MNCELQDGADPAAARGHAASAKVSGKYLDLGEKYLGKILCVYSGPLSAVLGREVYLKLDNLQPGGSFKIRGIGRTMTEAAARGATVFIGGDLLQAVQYFVGTACNK